jgi:hypothetical protein
MKLWNCNAHSSHKTALQAAPARIFKSTLEKKALKANLQPFENNQKVVKVEDIESHFLLSP